jgi:hypothetical protein
VTDQDPDQDPEELHEVDDPDIDSDPEEPDPPSRTFDGWRRRSAIGGIATGIAMGLQEVFQPNKNEPVLVAEAPGDPPDADRGFRVVLDPDDPTKATVIMATPPNPPSDQPE